MFDVHFVIIVLCCGCDVIAVLSALCCASFGALFSVSISLTFVMARVPLAECVVLWTLVVL